MERPAKRLRIGLAPYDDKEDDELGLEPEEFEQLELSKDPGYQLEQGRAKAAYKLKSTFEHIFEKYEKDFTDVGDEIDLRTGEIVVDNGHLQSMKDARDDAASQAGRTEDARSEADSIEEEERILHGGKIGPDGSSTALVPRSLDYNGGQVPRLSSLMDGSSRLSSMMPFSRMPFAPFTPPRSFASFAIPSDPIESPWRAPELPSSAFSAAFRPQGLLGRGARGATRTIIRKALPRPQIVDERQNGEMEDDDILLGVSGNGLMRKGLPSPQGRKEQTQGVSEDADSRTKTITSPNGEVSGPQTHGKATAGDSPKVMKTVLSMRPPDPSSKTARSKQQTTATKPKSRKDKTVVVVHDSKQTNNANSSKNRSSAKRRRSQQASSSPKQVVVVTSRKNRAGSLAQETVTTPARRSTRERKQIEFYRNSDWAKRGDPHKRALYVELSTKGIDTNAYSRVNISVTPRKSAANLGMGGFVEELNSRDNSPSAQETIPAGNAALDGAEATNPGDKAQEQHNPKAVPEAFSRNTVDPSYAFSDEEDDLPRRKDTRRTQTGEKMNSSQPAVPVTKGADAVVAKEQGSSPETPVAASNAPKRSRQRKSAANAVNERAESVELGEEQHEPLRPDEATATEKTQVESVPKTKSRKPQQSSIKAKAPEISSVPAPALSVSQEPDHGSAQGSSLPITPNHKKAQTEKPTPQLSSARTGIMSLISDDEEDELSFSTEDLTSSDARRRSFVFHRSSPMGSASTPRKANRNRSLLVSSHSKARTPVRVSLGSTGKLSKSISIDGRYSLPRSVIRVKGSRVSSPSSSLVRTPGGTMRRCGEDGFKCDRDFCFTCM